MVAGNLCNTLKKTSNQEMDDTDKFLHRENIFRIDWVKEVEWVNRHIYTFSLNSTKNDRILKVQYLFGHIVSYYYTQKI